MLYTYINSIDPGQKASITPMGIFESCGCSSKECGGYLSDLTSRQCMENYSLGEISAWWVTLNLIAGNGSLFIIVYLKFTHLFDS